VGVEKEPKQEWNTIQHHLNVKNVGWLDEISTTSGRNVGQGTKHKGYNNREVGVPKGEGTPEKKSTPLLSQGSYRNVLV
jgi:hypothetical protein